MGYCCSGKEILGKSTAINKANEYYIEFGQRYGVVEKTKGSYIVAKWEEIPGGIDIFYDTNVLE